ncbi:hypothetical protein CHS0354_040219 [Potamilus streckersoni]|uniref:Uncharacterized protein n=1 Tax=Potamilus streckersoni TaxID=2493646 RepID=A0AAE0VV31_9BIVA|nr:hypothetical protein CHS0354_040219 [Potamilus streckersoni]
MTGRSETAALSQDQAGDVPSNSLPLGLEIILHQRGEEDRNTGCAVIRYEDFERSWITSKMFVPGVQKGRFVPSVKLTLFFHLELFYDELYLQIHPITMANSCLRSGLDNVTWNLNENLIRRNDDCLFLFVTLQVQAGLSHSQHLIFSHWVA